MAIRSDPAEADQVDVDDRVEVSVVDGVVHVAVDVVVLPPNTLRL